MRVFPSSERTTPPTPDPTSTSRPQRGICAVSIVMATALAVLMFAPTNLTLLGAAPSINPPAPTVITVQATTANTPINGQVAVLMHSPDSVLMHDGNCVLMADGTEHCADDPTSGIFLGANLPDSGHNATALKFFNDPISGKAVAIKYCVRKPTTVALSIHANPDQVAEPHDNSLALCLLGRKATVALTLLGHSTVRA